MPEDDHDSTLRRLLDRIRGALRRSSSEYEALALDKHLLQDLADAGEKALQEIETLRRELAEMGLELEQEQSKAAGARPGVDPCVVS